MGCEGDSLTSGLGVAPEDSYPSQLAVLLGGAWLVDNDGISGARVTQLNTTTLDFKSCTERIANVIVVLIGINDLLIYGSDATTTYNALRSWCLARRIAGFDVRVCTLFAWDVGAWGHEADRLEYNDLIRTNWADFADGIVDLAGDPVLDTYTGAPIWLDSVHLDTDGHAIVADLVHAEILTL